MATTSLSDDLQTGSIEVRLTGVTYAARDINLYEFTPTAREVLPPVSAGAHIDVYLPGGPMRQYSLLSAADNPRTYQIGVKRDVNGKGGSRYLHDELRVGALLRLSEPRNNFALDETAAHTVLIAGGIGITPIWCMLNRLEALGRSWSLFYSARARSEAAFLNLLEHRQQMHLHLDEDNPGRFLDLSAIVAGAPQGAHFYCCGPLPMLTAYEAATAALPRECVHIEYFTSKHGVAKEGGFVVELARSGKSFEVPHGKTILQVLREAGFVVPSSCEEGVCGACETKIIAGEADHRDAILTESERSANISMMICCSGAKSARLLLDL